MADKCPVSMWDNFRSHTCDRPVKRDGLCGIHAAACDRRSENARKRQEDAVRWAAERNERVERARRLTAVLGFECLPTSTGDIRIGEATVRQLLGEVL